MRTPTLFELSARKLNRGSIRGLPEQMQDRVYHAVMHTIAKQAAAQAPSYRQWNAIFGTKRPNTLVDARTENVIGQYIAKRGNAARELTKMRNKSRNIRG